MASRKILDISYNGYKYRGYKTDDQVNPFRLYEVWWNMGEHKKLIEKYSDFYSMMCRMHQLYRGM